MLRLLVVNRLLEPGSEFRVHRHWFVESAMDALLEENFAVADKDRLYRCLDRVLEHKQDLFVWLKQKWAELFQADFEVLLYDLTSTYFEGEMEENPKAKRGYSRDSRPDCLQVVIALDHRSLITYTIITSSILYFQRNTTGAALISSKYW